MAIEDKRTMKQGTTIVGLLMPLGAQVGGAEALLGHLLRHGSDRYHYVLGFLDEGPLVTEMRKLGYDVTVFAATRISDVGNYFSTVLKVRRWLIDKHIQVGTSWMSKGHLYMGLAAVGLRVKILWYQHSVPLGEARMDRIITAIPANAVLCCSKTAQTGQDRLFPRRKSFVCYPGVLMPQAGGPTKAEARRALNLPESSAVVGMVARLERWKGAHVFVDAARIALEADPFLTLFIVGGPHRRDLKYAEEIRLKVEELNAADRFILAGQRPMDEAILWQTAADIVVHPVTGVEPFGMAVVEAMAQGKVVVTTDRGGPSEVIEDGVNGVLIESGNARLLAETIGRLLNDPEGRRHIESQAYVRGRSFSISAFTSRFESVIWNVLAGT